MPRKSAAALATSPALPISPPRLQPPPGLASDEHELFLDLVASARPEHFQGVDVPLLAAYVRACILERAAAAEIKRAMGEAPSALLHVYERATKVLHMLSMRLRLSPQARQPHLSRGSNTRAAPPSIYDRLMMEAGDGSDPA
jgi:hypothetical protein